MIIVEAVPAAENESDPTVVNRGACLLGDELACRRYSDDLSAQDECACHEARPGFIRSLDPGFKGGTFCHKRLTHK